MLLRIAIATLCVAWAGLALSAVEERVRAAQNEELPPGRGREILESACTVCHGLEEVTNLRGKLTREDWQGLVKKMTDYGAEVEAKDVEVLVDYLDRQLGKR